jgi:hypothetical protein
VATEKRRITNFFPFSFVAVVGSGIRDPGSGIQDKHPRSATLPEINLIMYQQYTKTKSNLLGLLLIKFF